MGALLERDSEQATIASVLSEAARGRGGMLLLRGVAGAGKSAMLDVAAREATARGMRVLRARGSDFERDFPFGAARQLLEPAVRAATPRQRDKLLSGSAALARSLFLGSDAGEARGADTAGLVEGLAWLIVALAHEAPGALVLVIDDLQSCDRPSRRVLARLALGLDRLPVAAVLAERTGEPEAEDDLITWLAMDAGTTVLDLAPLSGEAVAELVERELGEAGAPEFLAACREVTGGNPFLLGELLAGLRGEGVAPAAGNASAVLDMVPDAVLRSVSARVGRLGSEARRLAQAVAVLGPRARLDEAGLLADLPVAEVVAGADRLAAAGLFAEGRPLSFRHPLLSAAVLQDIGALGAAALHGRAARLLRAGGDSIERVAAHLLACPPEGDPETVQDLRSAAAEHMRQGGHAEAVPLLRRALEEPPAPDVRGALLLELARAEAASGEPLATERLLSGIELVRDPEERVGALRDLGRLQFLGEHHPEAAATITRARAELPPDHPVQLDLLVEYLASAGVGTSTIQPAVRADAERQFAALLAQHREGTLPDAPALLVQVANLIAAARGPRPEVRALIERALAHGPLDGLAPYGLAPSWAVLALMCVDELSLAERVAERSVRTAEEDGSTYQAGKAAFSRAIVATEAGFLDRAVAACETALGLAQSGIPSTLVWCAALLAKAQRQRGDLAAAWRALAVAERTDPDGTAFGIGLHQRAAVRLAAGDVMGAWTDAQAARDRLGSYHLRDYPLFDWRLTAALAARGLGDLASARTLVEEELAMARGAGTPRSIGAALLVRADLEAGGAQLPILEEAVDALSGSQVRVLRAEGLYRLGAARRRHVSHGAAREPLLEALEAARVCGADPLADRILSELRLMGVRPRQASRSGLGALSPAERRIVRPVTRGLTNRQIAAELHLTVSTVEFHLTNVYRKLGVSSRRELAALVAAEDSARGNERLSA